MHYGKNRQYLSNYYLIPEKKTIVQGAIPYQLRNPACEQLHKPLIFFNQVMGFVQYGFLNLTFQTQHWLYRISSFLTMAGLWQIGRRA